MTPTERVAVLERGLDALRRIEAQRWAALPPPERPDAEQLRQLRDLIAFADHLEVALGFVGEEPAAVWGRDAHLTIGRDPAGTALVAALAADTGAGTPYREGPPPAGDAAALRALAGLLARYDAREFMPPDAYFGVGDDEP